MAAMEILYRNNGISHERLECARMIKTGDAIALRSPKTSIQDPRFPDIASRPQRRYVSARAPAPGRGENVEMLISGEITQER